MFYSKNKNLAPLKLHFAPPNPKTSLRTWKEGFTPSKNTSTIVQWPSSLLKQILSKPLVTEKIISNTAKTAHLWTPPLAISWSASSNRICVKKPQTVPGKPALLLELLVAAFVSSIVCAFSTEFCTGSSIFLSEWHRRFFASSWGQMYHLVRPTACHRQTRQTFLIAYYPVARCSVFDANITNHGPNKTCS